MRNLNNFAELVAGISEPWLCDYLKVNHKTIKRWKAGTTDAPEAIRKLLRIKLEGDLSALGGEGWQGFKMGWKDHLLYIPFFRGGFDPEQIKAMFFTVQDAWADKRDLKHLREQFAALKIELEEAKGTSHTEKKK